MSVESAARASETAHSRQLGLPPAGLYDRVCGAERRAIDRLLEARTAEGCWRQSFDLSAMAGAAYAVMLRTSGLIEQPGAARDEAAIVRHMLHQRNADGGFFKFPGSPSSRAVTGLAQTAIRLSLGRVDAAHRPQRWFAHNPLVAGDLAQQLAEAVDGCEAFLNRPRGAGGWRFEADATLPASILQAYADPVRHRPPIFPLGPRMVAAGQRLPILSAVGRQFSALVRRVLPAVAIVHRSARDGRRLARAAVRSDDPLPTSRQPGRASRELAQMIAARQNRRGDWFYCAPYTMLSLMALRAVGRPVDDPAVTRAHRFLRASMVPTEDGRCAVSLMNSDVWDTSVALFTCLTAGRRVANDPTILPAIEFLLDNQGPDGGYGWGSGSVNDCDVDSTAAVLRALTVALKSASPGLAIPVGDAVARCRGYLQSRQSRQGGFSVWDPTVFRARPGAVGFLRASLIDVPSADLTARVLAALIASGSAPSDPPIRLGLRFLRRLQSPNGGWWCRWWAGYIPGTAFVLDALAMAGIRWNRSTDARDRTTEKLWRSLARGIKFLLDHQNTDGGWGETIRADVDARWAGRGPSQPGQTAAALLGLLSCGYPATTGEVRRGVEWLLASAIDEGRWQDRQATYTILPGSAYYAHPMYALTILPAALTAYLRAIDSQQSGPS